MKAASAQSPLTLMNSERFAALWERCIDGEIRDSDRRHAEQLYEDLVERYSQPRRHYHTCRHIEHCLRQMDWAAESLGSSESAELALWFHDAVYDPLANDNEQRSADWFSEVAAGRLDEAVRRRVRAMILATTHRAAPRLPAEQFVVDVDLSSLGLPWQQFRRDGAAIRREFSHLPDAAFFAGQIRFLQSLLDRPRLYFTEPFRKRYEKSARNNIGRYFEELSAQGWG